MINVFFFYGLAFILMGIFIFIMPKKRDLLGLSDNLWLIGLFGLFHGLNEWIDLFVTRGEPFNFEKLKLIGSFLLPISFIFLIIFGTRTIVKATNKFKWLNFLWVIFVLIWVRAYFFTKSTLVLGAVARYFICIPGVILTSIGLHLSIKKVKKQQIPKIVTLWVPIAIFTFIVYGILSGIVVPKAEFFPASIVNYANFTILVGLPVQFFKMLCAIILAISFFIITKYYFHKSKRIRIRGGIGSKVASLIIGVVLIAAISSAILGYFTEAKLLKKTIFNYHEEFTGLLASSVERIISEDIEDISILLASGLWVDKIAEYNLKYSTMEVEDITKYLLEIDKRWIDAPLDDPLIKEYLERDISLKSCKAISYEGNLAEFFITDRFGGVIAASDKTTDFYQADEEWWQFAFNKGKNYIGNIEFDQSSNIWGLIFAFPIKDIKGQIIGVAKTTLNAKKLFNFLEKFKIGETGHVALVDENGYIIYHVGFMPGMIQFNERESFHEHASSVTNLFKFKKKNNVKRKYFTNYATINQANLLENGHQWRVYLAQDIDEVYLPLKELAVKRFFPTIGLVIFLIPIGFFYGRIFTRPISELSKATKHIGRGDLDFRVNIKTGDEIEDLADSFNNMVKDLKVTTTSIEKLNKEIREREKAELEMKSISKFPSENPNPVLRIASDGKVLYRNYIVSVLLEESNMPSDDIAPIMPKDFIGLTKKCLKDNKVFHDLDVTIKNKIYSYSMIPVVKEGYVNFYGLDVTERKEAEVVIRKAAKEWQRTFDSITDLVFIQDADSNIIRVNKSFAVAMKTKPEDIIGKKCYQVVHGGDSPWPGCPFQTMMKDGKACSKEINDPKIGIPLLVMVSPIFDEERKIVGAVHIAKDITEHKKVEKLKDEFVSTVSHELRTPLSIIKEGVSLVLDEVPGKISQKQKDILKMSKENIDCLARIINDLLDISKIEAGKMELKKTVIDMAEMIRKLYQEWNLGGNKKEQSFECRVPDSPVKIHADPDKIIQILDNLVSNAIKYTFAKGRIAIELINKKDSIEISVSDTGCGISKKDLSRVFTKFQQFGRVAGTGAKGTGLGLAITKELVKDHGGTIKVESKLNKGTKFTVILPKSVNA